MTNGASLVIGAWSLVIASSFGISHSSFSPPPPPRPPSSPPPPPPPPPPGPPSPPPPPPPPPSPPRPPPPPPPPPPAPPVAHVTGVERMDQDTVRFTFDTAVVDLGACQDLRVGGNGPNAA